MKIVLIISMALLIFSMEAFSQTDVEIRDSITNLLNGNWYWVGTSGGQGNFGYGGPVENGYTIQIKLENTNDDDSVKFTVSKNDVIVRKGKAIVEIFNKEFAVWKIKSIMPDEHTEIVHPDDQYIHFQFINNDSIQFFHTACADCFNYIYSRNPCKDCYPRYFVNPYKIWIVATETYDGEHYLPPVSEYLDFSRKTATVNDTVYLKLFSSIKWNRSESKLHSYWREDASGRIFRRYENHNEELVYDFSLSVGDTIKYTDKEKNAVVDSVLTKPFGIVEKKYIYAHLVIQPSHILTWIEGVGSLFGPNVNDDYFLTGVKSTLVCYDENSQQIYNNPEYNACFYTSSNDIPNSDKGFKVYPNPVSGELFIQLTSNIEEAYTLEMYSVKGELVKTECMDPGSTLHRIDTRSLRNGIYIFRLISDSGKYDEKVIVKE